MTTRLSQILSRHDAHEPVAAIATACQVSPGYVYGILREHRPDRTRKPRTRTSDKRRMILGLSAQGHKVARVAFLCKVSRTYCYRVIGEQET